MANSPYGDPPHGNSPHGDNTATHQDWYKDSPNSPLQVLPQLPPNSSGGSGGNGGKPQLPLSQAQRSQRASREKAKQRAAQEVVASVGELRMMVKGLRAPIASMCIDMQQLLRELQGPLVQWIRGAERAASGSERRLRSTLRVCLREVYARTQLHEQLWRASGNELVVCQVRPMASSAGSLADISSSSAGGLVVVNSDSGIASSPTSSSSTSGLDQAVVVVDKFGDKTSFRHFGQIYSGSSPGDGPARTVIQPAVRSVLDGKPACIFFFGALPPPVVVLSPLQGAAGVAGAAGAAAGRGVDANGSGAAPVRATDVSMIGLVLGEVFRSVEQERESARSLGIAVNRYSFSLSYVEVVGDKIYDLLAPPTPTPTPLDPVQVRIHPPLTHPLTHPLTYPLTHPLPLPSCRSLGRRRTM
jgi:hypothetical protein